jgi:hypothetical protein
VLCGPRSPGRGIGPEASWTYRGSDQRNQADHSQRRTSGFECGGGISRDLLISQCLLCCAPQSFAQIFRRIRAANDVPEFRCIASNDGVLSYRREGTQVFGCEIQSEHVKLIQR